MVGYFGFKIVYYAIVEYLNNESLSADVYLFIQSFDLLFLGGVLFTFRSRDWPPFYSVGINEFSQRYDNPFGQNNTTAPLLYRTIVYAPVHELLITKRALFEDR